MFNINFGVAVPMVVLENLKLPLVYDRRLFAGTVSVELVAIAVGAVAIFLDPI